MMTNQQMLRIEATAPSYAARYAIHYARCQYGNEIGRKVATLVADGREVDVLSGPAEGFRVDGEAVQLVFGPPRKDGRRRWILEVRS